MKYILATGWEEGVADLAKRLVHELAAGKHILWLVTGGSNIPASLVVMQNISAELSQNLSVMLADERYGPVGHADSNWAQLMQAGFEGKQAKFLPILQSGDSFEQAGNHFQQLAEQAFADNELIIAQMGIGPDGHIAGILPGSPASQEQEALVSAYEQPPYQRLTLTFPALRHATADYSFAFGETKRAALTKLESQTVELSRQPAQILKQLPEAYVYSDQVGAHQ